MKEGIKKKVDPEDWILPISVQAMHGMALGMFHPVLVRDMCSRDYETFNPTVEPLGRWAEEEMASFEQQQTWSLALFAEYVNQYRPQFVEILEIDDKTV